ncbi:hypothetical protein AIOL_003965 [Candidatus Rhodobacter oscarellae]|uniref:Uncharacterized protein n=1 Tax=Candidatus Rhodobacter oscarellae TaxID=1675527 RepID=A0A0J9EBB4_9RHOB|nr:hypothetical protein [Candidatus Rhodobacter lobularis]KMW58984.1 hypothetical protein AIOL_003965 [Candidatus Rhodobacter lobularis]
MRVSQIRPQEAVTLNTDVLDEMCVQLGHGKAEVAICAAMEDLAVLLQYSGTLLKAGDLETLQVTSQQVNGLAERTGMVRLARVAKDVTMLSERGDVPALAATTARMRRVGEQSLIAMWDREDLTI